MIVFIFWLLIFIDVILYMRLPWSYIQKHNVYWRRLFPLSGFWMTYKYYVLKEKDDG